MKPSCWDGVIPYPRTSTSTALTSNASAEQERSKLGPSSALHSSFSGSPPLAAGGGWQQRCGPSQPAPIASTRGTPRRRAPRAAPRARAGIGQAGRSRAEPSRAVPRGGGPERPAGGTRHLGEPRPPARIPAESRGQRGGPQPVEERRELTEVVHGAGGAAARSPQRLATFPPRPRACPPPARSRWRRACPRLPPAGGSEGNAPARRGGQLGVPALRPRVGSCGGRRGVP